MRDYRRILVPVDGSATGAQALVHALNIARDTGGCVRLVHAVDPVAFVTGFEAGGQMYALARQAGEDVLKDAEEVAKAAGVPAETHLADQPGERLGETIAREARQWRADLIVVGTHGRRGVGRVFLGSGAEQVIRQAPVPVLVIRAAESGDDAATP